MKINYRKRDNTCGLKLLMENGKKIVALPFVLASINDERTGIP
jgi:hypothetical protein